MITKYLQENNLSSNVSVSVQVSKHHIFYKTLKKEDDLYKRFEYTSLVNVLYTPTSCSKRASGGAID